MGQVQGGVVGLVDPVDKEGAGGGGDGGGVEHDGTAQDVERDETAETEEGGDEVSGVGVGAETEGALGVPEGGGGGVGVWGRSWTTWRAVSTSEGVRSRARGSSMSEK